MMRSWRATAVIVLALAIATGCAAPSTPAGPVPFTAGCPPMLAAWPTTPAAPPLAAPTPAAPPATPTPPTTPAARPTTHTASRTTIAVEPTTPGLPASAPPDRPSVPDLPADAPVGRGVMVFRTCAECGANLLTESGAVYNLRPIPSAAVVPTPTDHAVTPVTQPPAPLDPMHAVRLSPDGRWLARPVAGRGTLLRDLTGTTVRQLDIHLGDRDAWSDDGHWLATTGSPARLLNLDSGRSSPISLGLGRENWRIAAVLAPDELLLADTYDQERRDPDRRHETFVTVDPRTGEVRHEYPMRFSADAEPWPAGRLMVAVTDSTETRPSDVVVFDLVEGGEIARWPLPVEQPARYTFWGAARVPGDGVVLIRDVAYAGELIETPTPHQPIHAEPVQLFSLDLTTGARRLSCTLPPRTAFVVRR